MLFKPGGEYLAIHRTVEDARRDDGVIAQSRNKRGYLPMAMRRVVDQPLALFAAPAQPRHLRAGSGFIDEDQLVGIEPGLRQPPRVTRTGYVLAVLFAGVQRFF